MNYGEWERASRYAIAITCIPIALLFVGGYGFPDTFHKFGTVLGISLLVLPVYIIASFIGWLLIGLPSHWLIIRYLHGYKLFYFVPVVIYWLLLYNTKGTGYANAMASIPATQTLVFLYLLSVLREKPNKSLNSDAQKSRAS